MFEISHCDVCGAKLSDRTLLGEFPIADDLSKTRQEAMGRELFPIAISLCDNCLTINQLIRLENHVLFADNYHYRANLTADVVNGMNSLLQEVDSILPLRNKSILDVGTNDGSLLDLALQYEPRLTIGVEPTNAIQDNKCDEHIKYKDYFTDTLAEQIIKQAGTLDVIVFTNVFAHIDPFSELMRAVLSAMTDETLLVIENHYLGSVLQNHQFDTFYHEHPRTYSLTSFKEIAARFNLHLEHASFPERYGGNIRVFMRKSGGGKKISREIQSQLEREQATLESQYRQLLKSISDWRNDITEKLSSLQSQSLPYFFRTLPARSSILLGLIPEHLVRGVPVCEKLGSKKIGLFVPRTGNEIVDVDNCPLVHDPNATCVNLSWHISQEIRADMQSRGFAGKFLDILSG